MSCFVHINGMQGNWESFTKIINAFDRFGNVQLITKMSESHRVLELDSFISAKQGQLYLEKIKYFWDSENNTTIHIDNKLCSEVQKIFNTLVFHNSSVP